MRVKISQDHNVWGHVKKMAATRCPTFYLAARKIKADITDLTKFPYVAQKSLAGLRFKIKVGSRQEEEMVNGPYFENQFLKDLLQCIKPDDVIYDVGAAIGTHTILAALKTGKEGLVYAFEPDKECIRKLKENIALNGLKNVIVLTTALWDKDSLITLHTSGITGHAPHTQKAGQTSGQDFKSHLPIRARSIISLVHQDNLKPPHVIKIDVEGAGQHVLEGLGNYRPKHIFLEAHPLFGENRPQIIKFLAKHGYHLTAEKRRLNEIHFHFSLPQ